MNQINPSSQIIVCILVINDCLISGVYRNSLKLVKVFTEHVKCRFIY